MSNNYTKTIEIRCPDCTCVSIYDITNTQSKYICDVCKKDLTSIIKKEIIKNE